MTFRAPALLAHGSYGTSARYPPRDVLTETLAGALAEFEIGVFKTKLIGRRGPLRTFDDVEIKPRMGRRAVPFDTPGWGSVERVATPGMRRRSAAVS